MTDGRVIEATFSPKRLDTLKPEVRPLIGVRMQFDHLWRIDPEDGGPYVGQDAWQAKGHPEAGWFPTEDLDDVAEICPEWSERSSA